MSLRTFLYAADALRIEEGITFTVQPGPGEKPAPRTDVAAQNAQAFAALMGQMAGVKKS